MSRVLRLFLLIASIVALSVAVVIRTDFRATTAPVVTTEPVATTTAARLAASAPVAVPAAAAPPLPSARQASLKTTSRPLAEPEPPIPSDLELPLIFERNAGQFAKEADFVSRGPGYAIALSGSKTQFALGGGEQEPRTVTMTLANQSCDTSDGAGEEAYSGPVNYLLGNDSRKWIRGVQSYRRVRYESVYPGIDLVFHGTNKQLEYDFVVAPGVDPDAIAVQFDGMDDLEVDGGGALVLRAGGRELRHEPPVAYQLNADGTRELVEASYARMDDTVRFAVGPYDASRELVIDPVLAFSTPIMPEARLNRIALDAAGNIWVTGTANAYFPFKATPGAFQEAWNRNQSFAGDAFVVKLNPTASDILFCTYLGGVASESPMLLHVTASGEVIVGGLTESFDFPVTDNAFMRSVPLSFDGGAHPEPLAFVSRLTANGASLVYSTHLAFDSFEREIGDMTVDGQERPILVGASYPSQYRNLHPVTEDRHPGTDGSAYFMRLKADGSGLDLSFRFGAGRFFSAGMRSTAVAVDSADNVYMAGVTESLVPVKNAAQPTCAYNINGVDRCSEDAFLVKFSSSGETLFATYWGGSENETVKDIAVAANGDVVMIGQTESTDFPLVNPLLATPHPYKGYLALFSSTGAALRSTYYEHRAQTVRFNTAGRLFVGHSDGTTVYADQSLTNVLWHHACGTGALDDCLPLDAAFDAAGNFYFVGPYIFLPSDPSILRTQNLQNSHTFDSFVGKIDMSAGATQRKLVSVVPEGGPTAGGERVFVNGGVFHDLFDFTPDRLFLDGTEASVDSSGDFITPPHGPGTVDVEVIDTNGIRHRLQDAYTYVSSPVTITGISPARINFPRYGEITISGTGFFPGIHVHLMDSTHFHHFLKSVRVVNSTTIVGITQGLRPGPYYVRIQVPGSDTVTNTSVTLTVDPPIVGALEPILGDVNGGTAGALYAGGLSQGATVLFDGIPATDFVVTENPSEFTGKVAFKTPRHPEPGWVDVTLKNPGSPDIVLPRAFRYTEDGPENRAPVPLNGPPSGGTSVTISGFDFSPDDLIMVDGIVVTQKTFIDEHTWLITTPPHHPGPAEIMMLSQNGGGQGGGYHSRFFYDGPYLESITPVEGSIDGGQEVTITGSGFDPAAVVKFGGVVATKVPDSNPLRVITPPHAAGRVDIEITNPDGTKGLLSGRYLYQGAAPTVTGVSPDSGSTAGGTVVTITGTNFVAGARVTFDSTPATNVQFASSSAIVATTPPRQLAGAVTVAVINPDHQTGNLSQGFTYRVAPIASTLTPAAGPATGGTSVVINGSSFDPGTQVSFGGAPAASVTYQSSTQITAVTPAHAVGDVDVVFTNPDGLTSTKVAGYRFLPPEPTITGFTPTSGTPATPVTITGTDFIFVTSVEFNNVAATYTVDSPTQITANVPNAGTTGPITVTTQSGIATSATNFTVESVSPQVDSFSPTLGTADTSVTIHGLRFTNATQVEFGGASAASFAVISATQINATAPANGLTGPICVTTPGPFTGCSSTDFVFPPRVSSFTPSGGAPGTSVTIHGVNFQGATAVTFEGGAAATPFTVSSDGRSITTTVPADAVSGPIRVTGPAGSSTSSMIFRLPPSITGFTPARGGPGNSIAISGTNLTGATAVAFNGLSASGFTVASDTLVNATVPAGATNGPISVTTIGGTAVSATAFEIAATATISGFNPTKGTPGTVVTITGTNFTGATAVQFNGATASFTLDSPTQIRANVPSTATNGPIAVTNAEGVGASAALFYLPPVLSSFAPTGGAPGATVTLYGNNFIGATAVAFNGTAAAFQVNAQDRITATVPAGATTGPITLTTPYGSVTTPFHFTALQDGVPTLTAVATSANSVLVTWSGNGANTYEVSRISNKNESFAFNVIARVSGNSFVDSTALSGRTYLYNVRNVSTNKYSNNDYATTIMFTDDPVGPGVRVKAVHLSEIRSAVNAMRAAAALSPATWTDPSPATVAIRAAHITELRARLMDALLALGRYASFSDSTLVRDMIVRGVHFQEVRQAVK